MGEGTDSRTAMETPAGSDVWSVVGKNRLNRLSGDGSIPWREIDITGLSNHFSAIVVYGEEGEATQRAERIVKAVNYHAQLVSIVSIIDADVQRGEPCPVCSQAPHRYDCGVPYVLAKVK